MPDARVKVRECRPCFGSDFFVGLKAVNPVSSTKWSVFLPFVFQVTFAWPGSGPAVTVSEVILLGFLGALASAGTTRKASAGTAAYASNRCSNCRLVATNSCGKRYASLSNNSVCSFNSSRQASLSIEVICWNWASENSMPVQFNSA